MNNTIFCIAISNIFIIVFAFYKYGYYKGRFNSLLEEAGDHQYTLRKDIAFLKNHLDKESQEHSETIQ